MLQKIFFFILAAFLNCSISAAQVHSVFGTVLNAETGEPLYLANVFFNKTTIGTQTDKNGRFLIKNIPNGMYMLVISYVGFTEAKVKLTFPRKTLRPLKVLMKPKTVELENLIVKGESPKIWKKGFETFKEYFLGVSRNADKIKILNPYVLEFKDNKELFIATAKRPIEIINKALGYHITYYLDKYVVNYPSLSAYGSVRFTPLKPESLQQLLFWKQQRKRAYQGSFRHFIDALVFDSLRAEGFIIEYTKKRFEEEGGYDILNPNQIWRYKKQQRIVISFTINYPFLRVTYTGEHPENRIALFAYQDPSGNQISYIKLPEDKAVIDLKSGAQIMPYKVLLYGYWAWSNRLPDLLPKNYSTNRLPSK